MIFPAARQSELDPVLEALQGVDGVDPPQQDDFNSHEIDVWLFMELCNGCRSSKDSPEPFKVSLRKVKARVAAKMNKLGVNWRWTDHPVPQYENIPAAYRFQGEPKRRKTGYDQCRLGIAVSV